jgi:outer membrane protein OmpA-like peptidoglycan-associated protein
MVSVEKSSPPHEPITLLVLGEGLFPRGQVNPKENIQEAIDKIIPVIKAQPSDNVIVEGHADRKKSDEVGRAQSSKWNKIISFQRAREIAMVLEQKGVASDRIIVKGLGDSVPIASNLTEEGREKNRRVEIKLSSSK